VDITAGNNTVSFTQYGKTATVSGFQAITSYACPAAWAPWTPPSWCASSGAASDCGSARRRRLRRVLSWRQRRIVTRLGLTDGADP